MQIQEKKWENNTYIKNKTREIESSSQMWKEWLDSLEESSTIIRTLIMVIKGGICPVPSFGRLYNCANIILSLSREPLV